MDIQKVDEETLKRVKFYTKPDGHPRLPVGLKSIVQLYRDEVRAAASSNDVPRLYRANRILYYCLT